VHRRDAREAARALFPPEPRRGLALLDPAYERSAEYEETAGIAAEIRRRWNTGILMVWYPVLAEGRHAALRERLLATHAGERILFSELRLSQPVRGPGLQGSGVAVLGAPWQLDRQARQTLSPRGRPSIRTAPAVCSRRWPLKTSAAGPSLSGSNPQNPLKPWM
jgi:23S rRNA (adenine2030-N6)-methyltransferase